MDFIVPNWPAPPNVQARVTLRETGDMAGEGREELDGILLHEPVWLQQVHGTTVIDADSPPPSPTGDASVARKRGNVCAVMVADCMPVFFTDGAQVAVAHAGWRGLAAGVLEATLQKFDPAKTCAPRSRDTRRHSHRPAPAIGCSTFTQSRGSGSRVCRESTAGASAPSPTAKGFIHSEGTKARNAWRR